MTDSSFPEDREARLVRNLLALRTVLTADLMQTGRGSERIAELDQELARLGHDMQSTVACAVESLRRAFLVPHLLRRRTSAAHRL